MIGDDAPLVLDGVIDLAFKEDDGWVLVDWKTDRSPTEETVHRYERQLQVYQASWEALSGEPVQESEALLRPRRDHAVIRSGAIEWTPSRFQASDHPCSDGSCGAGVSDLLRGHGLRRYVRSNSLLVVVRISPTLQFERCFEGPSIPAVTLPLDVRPVTYTVTGSGI
jgi:hypothetical protein